MLESIKGIIGLFALLSLSLTVGCSVAPDISFDGEYKFHRYIEGRNVKQIVIGDDLQNDVNNWLKQRRSWITDPNSYAPGSVIRSDHFNLNRVENRIVLNYRVKSSDRWWQYSGPIDGEIKRIFDELYKLTEQDTAVLERELEKHGAPEEELDQ